MKYIRLTKEQFEALHEEFARFLATQSITADEWTKLKEEQPELAEAELDLFSDLVWEGVIQKAEYLEKIDSNQLFLFRIEESDMKLIALKVKDTSKDITQTEDFQWLLKNYMSDEVEVFQSSKPFSEDKHAEIFELLKMGSAISKGEWYTFFDGVISSEE
ncbi:hypothetical protein J1N09_15075 [Aureitalea sp. L0-47]|uniref:DUF6495 family protein n=1 Tax=Aureitalea sp. L0-47 TaxID=2816962 RepID=UPI002237ADE1|nr:DUF6495 family protein [Aureitalea sp. L0-47]MCW5521169.1 hypothetical protein [Aureitalea sp. L0-47]